MYYASSQASEELQAVVSNKEALLQQVKLLTDSEHQLVRGGYGGAGMLFMYIPAEKSVRLMAKTKGYNSTGVSIDFFPPLRSLSQACQYMPILYVC